MAKITKQELGLMAFYAALTAIVLWPIFSVDIPGLGDYLNHLARIHVITTEARSPALQRFYAVSWNFTPYMGMDLVAGALSLVMPIYQAGRLFIALCVLMPVIGVMALRQAVYGRVGLVPAAAFLLCYNYPLSLGFLDYIFSAGLATLLLALWIVSEHWQRWPRAALFAALLLLVYFSHAFAGAAYCVAVAGIEIARVFRTGFRPIPRIAADWLAAASTAAPALWFATHVDLGHAFPGPAVTRYGSLADKLAAFLSPILFPGSGTASVMTLSLVVLTFIVVRRKLQLSPRLWPAGAAVAGTALVVPHVLLSVWGTDFRLPILACVLLIGSMALPGRLHRRAALSLLAGLTSLIVAKSVAVTATLNAVSQQISDIRRLVGFMPPGQRLLVIDNDDPDAPLRVVPDIMTFHTPMVAVIDRDAFLPYLFVGVTLVHVRDALMLSGSANGQPITLSQLQDGLQHTDAGTGPALFGYSGRVYWYGWPRKFDYVLIEHFGKPVPGLPPFLHRLATSPIADMYRIDLTPDRPPEKPPRT